MEPALFIFLGIFLVVGIRLVAGSMDGDRIDQYASERGWTILERGWEPFGPGWFGEKNARIYRIVYEDQDGQRNEAHVKTSVLSGVYLTDTKPVGEPRASRGDRVRDLEAENAELRARLEALENDRG